MTKSFAIILIIFLSASCGIKKRKHLKGFYIPRKSAIKSTEIYKKPTRDWSGVFSSEKKSIVDSNQKPLQIHHSQLAEFGKQETDLSVEILELEATMSSEKTEKKCRNYAVVKSNYKEDNMEKELHPLVKRSEILAIVSFLFLLIGIGIIGMIFALVFATQGKKAIAAEPEKYKGRKNANVVLWICWISLILLSVLAIVFLTGGFGVGILPIMLF